MDLIISAHHDNRAKQSDGGLVSLARGDVDTKCEDGAPFSRRPLLGQCLESEDCGPFAKDLLSKVLQNVKKSEPERPVGRI